MLKRIYGTPIRKQMVTNIVENMRKIRPEGRNFDYEVQLENKWGYSRLNTFESEGRLRNISQIYINDSFLSGEIKAAIGNHSGAIDLEQIPFFMSTKKAIKKINRFLDLLQQEKRDNPISKGPLPVESKSILKMQETFDKYKLQTTILESGVKVPLERIPRYKTL